ncbi:SDR family NAD(P)-dependent oxidoreductase [Gimesia sp.]|uniref:SDR family NAD(P)-dependent oxidoreductase n=1 Tax=Gimesia sp. TaxID=2024833 RepID=UPI003A93065A
MDLKLTGAAVVITGGASGIGLATARTFAAEGAGIVLWDQSDKVSETARELSEETGQSVTGFQVDITDFTAVQKTTEQTVAQTSKITHLVHAAAIGSGKFGFPFTNLTPADWPRVFEVNMQGMVHVAHAVAPVMQEAGTGSMIFISSIAGQIGSQTDPPYSASKAANINFAQCLAKDLARHGIRVNSVCPGMVQTPLNRSVWQAWNNRQAPADQKSYEDWAGEKIRQLVPLQRWQTPEDIADMIVFLSSARASQVTGQTINVDGGFVMHW